MTGQVTRSTRRDRRVLEAPSPSPSLRLPPAKIRQGDRLSFVACEAYRKSSESVAKQFCQLAAIELGMFGWLSRQGLDVTSIVGPSRQLEWPWALQHLQSFKRPRVLDIGSDEIFILSLLTSGVNDLTAYKTWIDVTTFGMAFVGSGFVPIDRFTTKFRNRFHYHLGRLSRVTPPFDLIFNISVMEHTDQPLFEQWLEESWPLLSPGGRMVFTCDWPTSDYPERTEGVGGSMRRRDFVPWLAKTEDAVLCVVNPEHVPWLHEPAVLPSYATTYDVHDVQENAPISFGVYGFCVEKHSPVPASA